MNCERFRDHVMEIDEIVNMSKEMQQLNPEIRDVLPVHVTGQADIDSQKVVFHLHLVGKLILPCSRTLADVEYPFDINSTETFLLNPLDYELGETEGGLCSRGRRYRFNANFSRAYYFLKFLCKYSLRRLRKMNNLPSGQGWEVLTEDQYNHQQEKEKQK